jgi:hypothetical protein
MYICIIMIGDFYKMKTILLMQHDTWTPCLWFKKYIKQILSYVSLFNGHFIW